MFVRISILSSYALSMILFNRQVLYQMEPMDVSISDTRNVETGNNQGNAVQVGSFESRVDDILTKVDKVLISGQVQTISIPVIYNFYFFYKSLT